jgi:GntR family transcriptional repressor for pyruvate dehydrogenase complex
VSIGRRSVAQEVVERIKQSLIRGDLKPGDYLPSESAMTGSLGVGKSSVREAIKMLEAIGVVETRRGQGVVIRQEPGNSLADPLAFGMILARGMTSDVLEFRRMFEPCYTLQAMQKATPDDDRKVARAIEAMELAIERGEQTAHHDAEFHRSILYATRNPMTIRVGETLISLIEAALATSMKTLPIQALNDHKAIYEGFKARNEGKVIDAIARSSESWETTMSYDDSAAPQLATSSGSKSPVRALTEDQWREREHLPPARQ